MPKKANGNQVSNKRNDVLHVIVPVGKQYDVGLFVREMEKNSIMSVLTPMARWIKSLRK